MNIWHFQIDNNHTIKRLNIFQILSDIDKDFIQTTHLLSPKPTRYGIKPSTNLTKSGKKVREHENLYMLTRLFTQESEHKLDKFEQKFLESKSFKNNMCNLPSINLNKTKLPKLTLVQSQKKLNNGKLPKLENKKINNFSSIQTKYNKDSKELGKSYFMDIIHSYKNRTVVNPKDKDNVSVIHDEDEISSFHN